MTNNILNINDPKTCFKMKKTISKLTRKAMLIMVITFSCLIKTNGQVIPNEYLGVWETDSTSITVRKKLKFLKYEFATNKVIITLYMGSKNNISGTIGEAIFNNAIIKKNKGNPDVNGIAYIIQCGTISKIFNVDNTGNKKIELWLNPINQSGKMKAEIRLRDGWDTFPMGEGLFTMIK